MPSEEKQEFKKIFIKYKMPKDNKKLFDKIVEDFSSIIKDESESTVDKVQNNMLKDEFMTMYLNNQSLMNDVQSYSIKYRSKVSNLKEVKEKRDTDKFKKCNIKFTVASQMCRAARFRSSEGIYGKRDRELDEEISKSINGQLSERGNLLLSELSKSSGYSEYIDMLKENKNRNRRIISQNR